ncbi:MAG: indole-3-glycerol phosphate synthase TrpC [Anaerolineae bacterium]
MILAELIASTRAALPARKAAVPLAALQERIATLPKVNDILQRLDQQSVGIIAEIKRASPSKGVLNPGLNPTELAGKYVRAGASGISVLTEPTHFGGSLADLGEVRQAVTRIQAGTWLCRKDFIVDTYQLYEARAWGADSTLLIVAALSDEDLASLYHTARQLGMVPLVEVHNETEMIRAGRISPLLVGINNRNLHTFAVDVETTFRLLPLAPRGAKVISESGIYSPDQMRMLAQHQVNGVLIGEALVTAPDPFTRLHELAEAGVW